jgi:lipopolysaccharide transport system ATP-binding protein
MSETVIRVENLSKRYIIGHQRNRHDGLRHRIEDALRSPFRWLRGRKGEPTGEKEEFWALKDVSFDVKQGEVVGIIGRNGAGKSTLLKILSRITEPTTGRIRIKGRVASLLEVGTGFHPELTGRENIFLNGAILGMSKVEIKRKFDEIVAFSEIEKFLDTPVKRYSSGMYVRLAFAVAAHLEPEILIVDEVLAVGDASFQKKCLGKMQDVSSRGRTVLFVSHSMPTILRLCQRVVLLQGGSLTGDGPADEITRQYLSSGTNRAAERVWETPEKAPGDQVARLHAVRVRDALGEVAETIDVSESFEIEVEYWNLQDRVKPTVSIHLTNEEGVLLFVSNDFSNQKWWSSERQPGLVRARCRVPAHLLAEGQFFVLAAVCTYNPDNVHALERDVVSFQTVDQYDLDKVREKYARSWPGALRLRLNWQVDELPDNIQENRTAGKELNYERPGKIFQGEHGQIDS